MPCPQNKVGAMSLHMDIFFTKASLSFLFSTKQILKLLWILKCNCQARVLVLVIVLDFSLRLVSIPVSKDQS